jgi:hypothetical protein
MMSAYSPVRCPTLWLAPSEESPTWCTQFVGLLSAKDDLL